MRKLATVCILILVFGARTLAQQTIFIVRHAERADGGAGGGASMTGNASMMANDPDLSESGRRRAEALAETLRDSGVKAVFVTEYKRTQQTAQPVARKLGLQPVIVSAKDPAALLDKIKAVEGPVLVVGHSNTVPELLTKLGVSNAPKLGDSDYDDLFIVTRGDKPFLIRLHLR